MGQKVNPISMRLQVNKDWRSKWFVDKKDYAKFLKDDLAVRRLISKKLGSRAAINKVEITRTPNLVTVTQKARPLRQAGRRKHRPPAGAPHQFPPRRQVLSRRRYARRRQGCARRGFRPFERRRNVPPRKRSCRFGSAAHYSRQHRLCTGKRPDSGRHYRRQGLDL
jgi:hypothetical protein